MSLRGPGQNPIVCWEPAVALQEGAFFVFDPLRMGIWGLTHPQASHASDTTRGKKENKAVDLRVVSGVASEGLTFGGLFA